MTELDRWPELALIVLHSFDGTQRLAESRDFYVQNFGFTITFEADWYVSLKMVDYPHYELALLVLLGYQPELYRCIECRAELTQAPHPFAAGLGGFLCDGCRGRAPGARIGSGDAQTYLRALDRGGLGATVRIGIAKPLREELEGVLGSYLRHVAERVLGCLRVWRELRDDSTN